MPPDPEGRAQRDPFYALEQAERDIAYHEREADAAHRRRAEAERAGIPIMLANAAEAVSLGDSVLRLVRYPDRIELLPTVPHCRLVPVPRPGPALGRPWPPTLRDGAHAASDPSPSDCEIDEAAYHAALEDERCKDLARGAIDRMVVRQSAAALPADAGPEADPDLHVLRDNGVA